MGDSADQVSSKPPDITLKVRSWLRARLANAGYYLSHDAAYGKDIRHIEWHTDDIRALLATESKILGSCLQSALIAEERAIRNEIVATMPQNLMLKGSKVFSQGDEDGITAAIFSNIGGGKTCIEVGCGNGTENNTHSLVLSGWMGVWIDGSEDNIHHINSELGGLSFPRLLVERQFVDAENIDSLVGRWCRFLGVRDVDFFSVDIDGNEFHIIERALAVFSPRVICAEYNAKFPPPLDLVMPYRATHVWEEDDFQGCSLMALVRLLKPRYELIACTMTGVNAFFVRHDLAQQFHLYPPEDLCQPARYHRNWQSAGHRSSLKWLKHIVGNAGHGQ